LASACVRGSGGAETFAEFARLCRDGGPQRCSLAAAGDPAVVVPATFDRLAREPVELALPDKTTVVITQQDAVALTHSTLFSPAAWPDLADFLAALAAPAPSPARLTATIAATRSPLGARLRGEDYPSVGNRGSVCVDTAPTRRVRDYPRLIDAADAQAPYFGRFAGWALLACEFWTLQDRDAYHGPWQQRTQTPVLVIGPALTPRPPTARRSRTRTCFRPRGCSRSTAGGTPRSGKARASTQRSPTTFSPVTRRRTKRSAPPTPSLSHHKPAHEQRRARTSHPDCPGKSSPVDACC